MASAQATIVEDLKDKRVPSALYWTTEHVADWIEELGFPQYKVFTVTDLCYELVPAFCLQPWAWIPPTLEEYLQFHEEPNL